jgi:hypothetical protein
MQQALERLGLDDKRGFSWRVRTEARKRREKYNEQQGMFHPEFLQ